MSFHKRVVLVTGGGSGIGAAIAIKFAEKGADVAIVGRNQEKLNAVVKICGNPLVLVADISKDEDAKRIVDETVKHFGKLDILVNNAGIGFSASLLSENAMSIFDQVMSTNLRSTVYLTHLAAPHLAKTKGNIVNISSIAGRQVYSSECFSYCTSKAAMDHFTRAAARELASSGIRVNVVNPGPVRTDIFENSGASKERVEAVFKHLTENTVLDRVSESEEIADLVVFLASDKARGITGSSVLSDNGMSLKTLDLKFD